MITREHQDKRLHIEFVDGEIADITVLVVSDCVEHEDCRGITYDVISTNRPEKLRPGSTYWTEMASIKDFQIIEE